MAEALLKRDLAGRDGNGVAIGSAGLYAREGQPADPRARSVALRFGIDLGGHRARPLTRALVDRTGLLVAMDALIEADLRGRYPDAAHKITLFHSNEGGGGPRPIEIPDPYEGDVAEIQRRYELLQTCVRRQAEDLLARRSEEREVKIRRAR
jgi:protein-tyrosine phosphatase